MAYTVEVIIALQPGERPSKKWWAERYQHAVVRAGGMPPEIVNPVHLKPTRETDPDNGDRYARVGILLAPDTTLARARELSHMLTSTLAAEGYTLRHEGKLEETLAGDWTGPLTGEFGGPGYAEARVCSGRCLPCALSSHTRIACCGEGAAFSLADIGSVLLAGADEFVARVLALPGQMDGIKWHPYLSGGKCVFHNPDRGCTLPAAHMPLQCRTYLCFPSKLLPPDLLADYEGYVDSLEEAEAFIEDHMRLESGVDFGSPLDALQKAARKAFAAWASGDLQIHR
ncbi:MAG TPA: hypothetical protein VD902_01965 [Symbiobacteriaceae bacterium]|nr:hypothetical protein [Symbiobacteriaceae bacterium]